MPVKRRGTMGREKRFTVQQVRDERAMDLGEGLASNTGITTGQNWQACQSRFMHVFTFGPNARGREVLRRIPDRTTDMVVAIVERPHEVY